MTHTLLILFIVHDNEKQYLEMELKPETECC